MFPRPQSRFTSMIRRSVDAAIDFATLGEYGLASAWEDPADAGSGTATRVRPADGMEPRAGTLTRGGATAVADRPAVALLRPASAAGRARVNGERREAPRCAGQPVRSRALEPALPRGARAREGMAPREQHCLFGSAG